MSLLFGSGSSLAFITNNQSAYITACYDAFARSYIGNKSTSVDEADITHSKSAWHYAEVKQQVHFKCETAKCGTETDLLGDGSAYCPRCGRSNARKVFIESMNKMLKQLQETKVNVSAESKRGSVWEQMTKDSVTQLGGSRQSSSIQVAVYSDDTEAEKAVRERKFSEPVPSRQGVVGVVRY